MSEKSGILNTELFIAKRIIGKRSSRSFSNSVVSIATFGIALGLAVMIVAIAIVTGFKNEITDKVSGFRSHIQVVNMDGNSSFETTPIKKDLPVIDEIRNLESVHYIQAFGLKPGIIKTNDNIQGAVLKGADTDFHWDFVRNNLVEGEALNINDSIRSKEVLISETFANSLGLELGDQFNMFFIQDPPSARSFIIKGIYRSSMPEFGVFVYCDMKHIIKLNQWNKDQISGYEVSLKNFRDIEHASEEIRDLVSVSFNEDGSRLKSVSIQENFKQVFDWLNLQDMNVIIIIILMMVVAGFNMISGLLILILERTNMIGILKGLGTINASIQKIFLYQSGYLAIKGLIWGNIIGLTLCLVQQYFHLVTLDPSSYYIDYVPINLNVLHLLALNAGTLLITILFLLIPSSIISRISPEKAIRFN